MEVFAAGRIDRDEGRLLAAREVDEDAVGDQGVRVHDPSARRIEALHRDDRAAAAIRFPGIAGAPVDPGEHGVCEPRADRATQLGVADEHEGEAGMEPIAADVASSLATNSGQP